MKCIVGLGNPGGKYENTRHNVGFVAVDALASQMGNNQWSVVKKFQSAISIQQSAIILIKPQTMMNNSGSAVKKIITQYKVNIPDLWVIHDDLDFKLASYKIQKGKGPREHNGLQSIYNSIGSKDFWHVRIGIDNREPEDRTPGETYVLQSFTDEEVDIIDSVIGEVVGGLFSDLEG